MDVRQYPFLKKRTIARLAQRKQAKCEHIKCRSPFLTCFPHLPFGKALRAGHSTRLTS